MIKGKDRKHKIEKSTDKEKIHKYIKYNNLKIQT